MIRHRLQNTMIFEGNWRDVMSIVIAVVKLVRPLVIIVAMLVVIVVILILLYRCCCRFLLLRL